MAIESRNNGICGIATNCLLEIEFYDESKIQSIAENTMHRKTLSVKTIYVLSTMLTLKANYWEIAFKNTKVFCRKAFESQYQYSM